MKTGDGRSARNGYVELIRLVLASAIAIMHFNASIPGAYLGVEFFFMLSGYFQMMQMCRPGFSPLRYSLERFLKLFFLYESSILLLSLFGDSGIDLPLFLHRLYICIPDMLCLQMTGLYELRINPELWYVSSMMTAGLVLALLYAANKRFFVYALPVICLFSYALLYRQYGTLEINYMLREFLIPSGTIRAFAGMGIGCLLYMATEAVHSIRSGRRKTLVLSCVSAFSLAICLVGICFRPESIYDYYLVFCGPVFLLGPLSGETMLSGLLDRIGKKLNAVLGRQFSFALLCYSAPCIVITPLFIPYRRLSAKMSVFVFLMLLFLLSFAGSRAADSFNRNVVTKLIARFKGIKLHQQV